MEKKRLTIIVVLTTVILIASLGAFLYFYEKKKANYFYLFTGDVNMIKWYYNNGKWYVVNANEKLDDLFDVYADGKYRGKYRLVFNDQWYYFDNNNSSVKFDSKTFMVNTNYDFKSYTFDYNFIQNDYLAKSVAAKVKLNSDNWTYSLTKVDVEDFEDIYLIDFYIDDDIDSMWTSYSVAFTYDNDSIKVIKSVDSRTISLGYCSLKANGIFTFDNNNPKLLLSCANFDRLPDQYFLYEYSWNNYKLLIESNGGA